MKVHLIDGTYELFRQFFGQPSRKASDDTEIGAVRGVVLSLMGMIESGEQQWTCCRPSRQRFGTSLMRRSSYRPC